MACKAPYPVQMVFAHSAALPVQNPWLGGRDGWEQAKQGRAGQEMARLGPKRG